MVIKDVVDFSCPPYIGRSHTRADQDFSSANLNFIALAGKEILTKTTYVANCSYSYG